MRVGSAVGNPTRVIARRKGAVRQPEKILSHAVMCGQARA